MPRRRRPLRTENGEVPISREAYPSDLTESQWLAVAPLVAPSATDEAGDAVDLREVVNAIRYARATGCKWAMLPHEFPPWGVVHSYYRRWRNDGTWERVQTVLTDAAGDETPPPAPAPEPRPVSSPLSPVHRLRVFRMCPYLGSRSNGMTRRAYPSTQNVCRAEHGRRRKVDRETQDSLCLGEGHKQCAYYQARAAQEAGETAPETNGETASVPLPESE